MTVDATTVTVGTTPTQISHVEQDITAGFTVAIHVPENGQVVYFGGRTVDTGQRGYPVQPGGDFVPSLDPNEVIWAVVASGTQDIKCFWQGV